MTARASGWWSRLGGYDTLGLAAGLWFLAKFLRYGISALFPQFQTAFGVSNATLGAAFSAMMLLYSLLQFPSGALSDRLGEVKIIAIGSLVAALGAFVLGVGAPFAVVLVGMALVGLGTGTHKTVAVELLARVYPARVGRSLGIFDTIGALGGVAAPAAVVLATGTVGWRALFALGGVCGVALVAGVLLRVPRRERTDTDGERSLAIRPYLVLFRDRRLAAFVVVTLCFGFAYNGLVAFLPLYLTQRGLATGTASLLYSLLFAVSVVQVLTGGLSDRLGRLPLAAVVLSVATAGLVGLIGLGGLVGLGAAVVVLGLGGHGFRPIRAAHLSTTIPEEIAGGGLGLVRTLLMGVGAVAPAVVGVIADVSDFRVAFSLLAVSMAAGAVVAVGLAVTEQ
ncbi:MFS transporter [Halococcus sp. IIIV-5B]|uniref:MFS transporter n=1 Tax=Halococcus sp. IIIV-5B TaxID=2321230 RepID=UPI000E725B4D|nr:MFS transporter [Halococcus sp. IIIV-5B]RJS98298.1 MFS transporter [Halococcus sp. IIIV-5B]